jgi:N-acetylglucosamine-6-phosphate deacetylase
MFADVTSGSHERFALCADAVFTGQTLLLGSGVEINGGIIERIVEQRNVRPNVPCVRLPSGMVLTAGFLDTQVNGGGGVLLNEAPTLASIRTITVAHRRFGTTGLLPTLLTDTPAVMAALLAIAPDALRIPGVLGFHLEGPFINPARKGVHREDLIRLPTESDIVVLKRFGALGRCVVTLAPELFTAAQLRELAASGLTLSAGHTAASYEQMCAATDAGVSGVTHLFNAMSQIEPRAAGVVGAALDDARLTVGLIADGHHVAGSNMRLAYRMKGSAGVMLVTDAMATAASAATSFALQGRTISRAGDRLTDAAGTLAGAHLTMNQAVKCFADAIGGDWTQAVVAATLTPACFLGLDETRGLIAPGRAADLVAFHRDTFEVYDTWINGIASNSPSHLP